MKRKIITTQDGSKTIHIEELNEQYHSIHGAIQEAQHVFIKHGLHFFNATLDSKVKNHISILEIGFGTGLNAFISLLEAEKLSINIDYIGIEAYPVIVEELAQLNYSELLLFYDSFKAFEKIHAITWNKKHIINSNFSLHKKMLLFSEVTDLNSYNIIYFDAFGARVQPELWTETMFERMFNALKDNGVLVTYSAKGSVRRAMESVGFLVERLPGPPGKREMLRAVKRI